MFKGLNTALITPFKNNEIDERSLIRLVEYQIENGANGIVPCGTTGESATLSHDEHKQVVEICVKAAKNRVKIIAGTGSNSTSEAISMTNHAKEVGADGCLIVAPYYNKPSAQGIYEHFKELNKCGIPIVLYNIPGRSAIDISDENIAKIAELENIVGVKDATGDLARIATLRLLIKKDFCYLSGEDATTVGFNAMGGDGVISVTANIAPKLCSQLQNATLNGDFKTALEIQDRLTNLHMSMFCETNPVPVKYGAYLAGLCENEYRLPLVEPNDSSKEKIAVEMKKIGIL